MIRLPHLRPWPTPWIDLGTSPIAGPAEPVEPAASPEPDHKLAAALTLGGLYAGFTTWTYFAWYRKHKPLSQFKWGGDGWLGVDDLRRRRRQVRSRVGDDEPRRGSAPSCCTSGAASTS